MHKKRKDGHVIKIRNVVAQTQKKWGPGGPLPEVGARILGPRRVGRRVWGFRRRWGAEAGGLGLGEGGPVPKKVTQIKKQQKKTKKNEKNQKKHRQNQKNEKMLVEPL